MDQSRLKFYKNFKKIKFNSEVFYKEQPKFLLSRHEIFDYIVNYFIINNYNLNFKKIKLNFKKTRINLILTKNIKIYNNKSIRLFLILDC